MLHLLQEATQLLVGRSHVLEAEVISLHEQL
jgi:hypothetical protein